MSDLDPLSQLEIERTIRTLMRQLRENTNEIRDRAKAVGKAEVAYRVAYARSFLSTNGPMDLRRQQAYIDAEAELGARGEAEALLITAKAAAENLRAELVAAQSLNSNIRHGVSHATGYGG